MRYIVAYFDVDAEVSCDSHGVVLLIPSYLCFGVDNAAGLKPNVYSPLLYISRCAYTRARIGHIWNGCDIWPGLLDRILKLDYTTIRSSHGAYRTMSVQENE